MSGVNADHFHTSINILRDGADGGSTTKKIGLRAIRLQGGVCCGGAEIAEMIQQEEEVTVVDNRNQKDITAATLTQIIFEKQKKADSPIPISTLRRRV